MKIYVFNISYHCPGSAEIKTRVYTSMHTDFDKAKKDLDLSHQIYLDEFKDTILKNKIATEPSIDTYTKDCTRYEFQMAKSEPHREWNHYTFSIKEFEI